MNENPEDYKPQYREFVARDNGASDDRYTHREEILDAAREAVLRQRNNTYGPPTQDFDRSAAILNALGFSVNGGPVESHHIAVVQIAVKLSRIIWSPQHKDSWVDVAGYAACGYECAMDPGNELPVRKPSEDGAQYIDPLSNWKEEVR